MKALFQSSYQAQAKCACARATATSENSIVPVANLCKSGAILFNSDTKHDLQVDSLNSNAQGKQNCIKVSTSNIWKKIIFKITILFNET